MDNNIEDGIVFFEIFPWNNNFNTGITIIDEQHKQLVSILNKLAAHLANLSEDIILNQIFDELVDYTDYHFKTEEKIWSEHFHGDVWFLEHEKTHEGFIEKILDLKNNQNTKSLDTLITELVSFLSKWLAYHILDTDKRMAKAVLLIQKGISIEESKQVSNDEMQGAMKVLVNTVLDMYDSLSSRTLDLMKEKTLRLKAEKELKYSEEKWKFILESDVDEVWDLDIEKNKLMISKDDISVILKNDVFSKIHKADKEQVQKKFTAHINGETDNFSSKYRILNTDGSWSWILSRGKVVSRNDKGEALRIVGVNSDITKRELASLIYKNSSQGMMITDIDNNILSVNPAFSEITGYDLEEVIGKNPNFMAYHNNQTVYKDIRHGIQKDGNWSGEIQNKHKNGTVYTQLLNVNTVVNESGRIENYVGLFYDITEQKKNNALILEQASTDSLTKLQNRRAFQTNLENEINKAERFNTEFTLLFIDLDHFKEVNDSLGHKIGDLLLIEVTQRLLGCIRKSDIVSRLGGDEFSIILSHFTKSINVDNIAQSILDALSQVFVIEDNKIYISASIGISLYPDDSQYASALLSNADQAMYLAKKSGRNCYRYFTHSMQEQAERRHHTIKDLYVAIDKEQFEVYFQAIEDLRTGEIKKAEALVRWRHPIKGIIYPDAFISLAEDSGLIVNIDNLVFKEAAKQTKIWQERYKIKFQTSINKSPVQFKEKNMVSEMDEYLRRINLANENIIIEITENVFIDDIAYISDLLQIFKELGFKISLDDFGTGYSSLSYLQKLNIDILKIDKSFVMNLTKDSPDLALCEAIISMAHKLGIKVIAEGIETKAQKELLSQLECDYGQGYFISKPLPANQFEELLKKSKNL